LCEISKCRITIGGFTGNTAPRIYGAVDDHCGVSDIVLEKLAIALRIGQRQRGIGIRANFHQLLKVVFDGLELFVMGLGGLHSGDAGQSFGQLRIGVAPRCRNCGGVLSGTYRIALKGVVGRQPLFDQILQTGDVDIGRFADLTLCAAVR
jgi:hypothetical protein